MSDVNEPRFAEYMKRVFGLRAGFGPTLQEDVMPVAPLFDSSAVELQAMRGDRPVSGASQAGPVGAQFSFVRLENPSTLAQPALLLVDQVRIGPSGAGTGVYYVGLAQSVGVGTSRTTYLTRDGRRYIPTARYIADLRDGSAAGDQTVRAHQMAVNAAADGEAIDRSGWVIPPQWSLVVWSWVLNFQTGIVTFCWRERPVDRGELLGD